MELWTQVQHTIARALDDRPPEAIRIPARRAACDCYWPEGPAPEAERFGTLLGAPLVAAVRVQNRRLLFDLTDAFYDACVAAVNDALPLPGDDSGSLALNRLLTLARQGGDRCPRVTAMQRAIWLCAGAARSPSQKKLAEAAVLTMLHELPVAKRQAVLHESGAFARACARLFARRPADFPESAPTETISERT